MQGKNGLNAELERLAKETKHEHHHHYDENGVCCCGHHHDEHEEDENCEHEHHHHDGEEHEPRHHHHHADEVFSSWGTETSVTFTKERLAAALAALDSGEYGQILRAKGFVDGSDVWYYFDFVPEEADIREGAPAVTGRLCVIGCDLNEEKLKTLFLG